MPEYDRGYGGDLRRGPRGRAMWGGNYGAAGRGVGNEPYYNPQDLERAPRRGGGSHRGRRGYDAGWY